MLCIGGKDSLVVWHMARRLSLSPVLMYSSDGLYEFEGSQRLQDIVRLGASPFVMGESVNTKTTYVT